MYVRDQFTRARPFVRAAARGRQAAQALSARQSDLPQLLGRLKAETQRAVTEVRRIVYGLRPPMLGELGLAGARWAVGLADTGDVVSADGVTRWRPR
jgi:signal transduction histidine kinase